MLNFEELLADHNVPFAGQGHRHYRHGWLNFDCPFCSPNSGEYYMGYNTRAGYVNCWYCGKHGLAETTALLFRITYNQAQTLTRGLGRRFAPDSAPLTGRFVPPACKLGPLGPAHTRYLRGRRFNPADIVALWGIQGIGLASRLGWRIYIPITRYGVDISWTTRKLSDVGMRYIGAKEEEEAYPSKKWLYGLDYCRGAVVLVEGCFDVWAIGPGAASSLGTAYTTAQINLLAAYPVRAVCFDQEPEAQKRARKLCDDLAIYPGVTTNIILDTGKDPAAAQKSEIAKIRKFFLE